MESERHIKALCKNLGHPTLNRWTRGKKYWPMCHREKVKKCDYLKLGSEKERVAPENFNPDPWPLINWGGFWIHTIGVATQYISSWVFKPMWTWFDSALKGSSKCKYKFFLNWIILRISREKFLETWTHIFKKSQNMRKQAQTYKSHQK